MFTGRAFLAIEFFGLIRSRDIDVARPEGLWQRSKTAGK